MAEATVETQEAPKETQETPPVVQSNTPSDDTWGFYNAEHIPEEHRGTWNDGIEKVKKALSSYTRLHEIKGFDELMEDGDWETFEELHSAWKAGRAAKNGNGTPPAKVEPKAAPNQAPEDPRLAALWEAHTQNVARQKVADLLNTYPEAKELLQDPDVRAKMQKLTGGDDALPLDAAYALATREAYATLKLKGSTTKTPPQPEGGSKSGEAPARKGPRDLDEILKDFVSRSNVGTEDE